MTRLSGMNDPDYDPWEATDDEPGEFDPASCHCDDPGPRAVDRERRDQNPNGFRRSGRW